MRSASGVWWCNVSESSSGSHVRLVWLQAQALPRARAKLQLGRTRESATGRKPPPSPKKDLSPGDQIGHGIGSFDLRGHAVRIAARPDHVPIGLIQAATVVEPVARGEVVRFDQIDLPDSLALKLWGEISARAVPGPAD